MYYFHNMPSALGQFAPDSYCDSAPEPRWGTSVHNTP